MKHGFQHVLQHSETEDDALPSETVFQHNHPKHTAEMTTALLLKVKVMEWPGMSPDLNPFEHTWGILKRKVEKHHVSNIQQLRHVKSSHLYLYSAFNNTNCVKVTAQYQNRKVFDLKAFHMEEWKRMPASVELHAQED